MFIREKNSFVSSLRRVVPTVFALLAACWLLRPDLAAAQAVPTAEITVSKTSVASDQTIQVSIRAQNAATGAPLSGASVVFSAKDKSSGTVATTTAPRNTNSDGQLTVNLGPVGRGGTYSIQATINGSTTITGPDLTVSAPAGSASSSSSGTSTSSSSGTPAKTSLSIPNPIKCNSVSCLISQIIRVILGVIAVVATFMFIWGGILMLTSGGNERQVARAKETLTWAAIGIIIILISWAIIQFVLRSLINAEKKKAQFLNEGPRISRVCAPFVV